jgi:hypothetical protein
MIANIAVLFGGAVLIWTGCMIMTGHHVRRMIAEEEEAEVTDSRRYH